MDAESIRTIKSAGIGCGIFFLIILLIICWDTVEPTEWGIKYNSVSKDINRETIYEGGRYLVSPFTSFVTFPRILKPIEFSLRPGAQSSPLKTRTAEGLALELYVAFQYQLIPEELPELYALANVDYEATFVRIARDILLQVAGTYVAPKYWTERTEIGDNMKKQLDNELKKAHARCKHLQILQVELPTTYEDSIVQTQVEVQNSKMKKFEQEAAIIRQEIDILSSETQQDIKLIEAEGRADSYLLKQTATATSTRNMINTEADQYSALKQALNLNQTMLNLFIFYNALSDNGGDLFVGFTNNMFVKQNTK